MAQYPGYAGPLTVTGTVGGFLKGEDAYIWYNVAGLEADCATTPQGVANACGIHIHEGKTCHDAAAVGGHYYDHAITSDPWSPVTYTASADGTSKGKTSANVGAGQDINGRAIVVHDKTGARVACGLIQGKLQTAHPSFQEWAAQYGLNSGDETMQAKYEANLVLIDALNAEANGAKFTVNQFSGMSPEEFEATMLNFQPEQSIANNATVPVFEVDYSLKTAVGAQDWAVSPVKDQGRCGSCWAFGAVAGMEGEARRQLGRSDILSEQYVMDCTSSNACFGGRADSAYPQLYGQPLYNEESYPYTAENGGKCHTGTDSGLRITRFTRTSRPVSDSALAAALDGSTQVVAVGASSWPSYSSGIYSGSTSCSLNHQVYLTGYDRTFFKVKNSWGRSWGESGYIRLARTSSGCGTSGILSDGGFFPTMGSSLVVV